MESSLYTLQQSFMKFGKSYEFHKSHSGKSVRMKRESFHNGIKSVHSAASDYEMHEFYDAFSYSKHQAKSPYTLRHLIMKCMNDMMHFHIQTNTLH